eukprot:6730302-Prymnesium_polylepis.1
MKSTRLIFRTRILLRHACARHRRSCGRKLAHVLTARSRRRSLRRAAVPNDVELVQKAAVGQRPCDASDAARRAEAVLHLVADAQLRS